MNSLIVRLNIFADQLACYFLDLKLPVQGKLLNVMWQPGW